METSAPGTSVYGQERGNSLLVVRVVLLHKTGVAERFAHTLNHGSPTGFAPAC